MVQMEPTMGADKKVLQLFAGKLRMQKSIIELQLMYGAMGTKLGVLRT